VAFFNSLLKGLSSGRRILLCMIYALKYIRRRLIIYITFSIGERILNDEV